MRSVAALCLVIAGCAAVAEVPAVRFANAPAVAVVDDREDVPNPPAKRQFLPFLYVFDGTVERRLTRGLELPRTRRALGVNALDDVPDSTWFTNRIGVRDLTPDEIRTGSVTHDPELHKPWTVRSTKIGGTSPGLLLKDASGVKYMIKFDIVEAPAELETGTHVAVNRLLWACGYNVPEDQIVYLRPADLVLAADATVKDLTGADVRRLDRAELVRQLERVRHEPDGRIRAMASRWIDGTTLGGHPGEGVRNDDPNDRIPHELRRDLRGQFSIYAWLDALDVTEGQYVDAWLADPADPARHYVEHYAIDFGKSLGAMAAIGHDWWRGFAYDIDFAGMVRTFITLGLAHRPWQDRSAPALRGVASVFEATTFDPGTWHPDTPAYAPFLTADRIDKFWGAKIVARFTRAQLHAAIEAARFSDPRAVDYITDTLVARQRATAAYWFARVDPLDRFEVERIGDSDALCFDDLAVRGGLVDGAAAHYAIAGFDGDGRAIGPRVELAATSDGHACTARPPLAPRDRDAGYTILRIASARPGLSGKTFVHVARAPSSGALRVVGVWRP
jgi:hypothetical protein